MFFVQHHIMIKILLFRVQYKDTLENTQSFLLSPGKSKRQVLTEFKEQKN